MKSNFIFELEQTFKTECKVIDLKQEYTQYREEIRWGIATYLSEKELRVQHINEIKVMEKPEGLFIAMPRRKKGERYYDIAHPINQEVRDKLTKAVLEKYEEAEDPEPVNKTEAESEDAE